MKDAEYISEEKTLKKTRKLEKSDKWIVGLSVLCALLLFSWLVYDIAFLNPLLEGQIEIGKIYEARNKVKRKFNRSLIWYAAEQNETVYENDWIFTGSQSIAKIKLNSGGEIIIEPDSLIILSRKNGVLQLDLQHGRLLADVKSKDIKINVVRDGLIERVDTSEGVVSVAQKEEAAAPTEIKDVDLDPDDDGKEDQTLSDLANQKYFEPDEGFKKLDVNGFSFPEQGEFDFDLYKGQTASAPLNWQDPFERWVNYEFELSQDETFETTLDQASSDKWLYIIKTKEPGTFFWRIRGQDENGNPGNWSETQIANVNINFLEKKKPLQLSRKKMLYQLDSNELENINPDRSYDVAAGKAIKIEWQGAEQAAAYKVQTSDKEDFSNILDEKVVKESSMELTNLKLGSTYFRVIPETAEGVAIAEEATGKVTTYFPPPADDSLKTIDENEYQVMTWDDVPFAEAYMVTYKTSKDSDEVKKEIVTDNQFRVENETGFLQWKVRVVDPESKKWLSSNSETVDWYDAAKRLASLHGTGMAGFKYPVITKPEPRKTFISVNSSPLFIVMNWKYTQGAPAYEVEISKRSDMKELVYSKRVKKTRAVINQKFKPGIYFMRVRAATEDVTQETWSEVEVFRVINRKAN